MKQINWPVVLKTCVRAIGLNLLLSLSLCAGLAILVTTQVLPIEGASKVLIILNTAIVFAMCCYTAKQTGKGRLIAAITYTCLATMCFLLVKGIFFPGFDLEIGWYFWVMLLLSIPAGLIVSQKNTRRK